MPRDITKPDPAVVLDHLEAFRRSKTMFAAVSLGVFDALAAGPKELSTLAAEIPADEASLGRLLDACVGLQLVTRAENRYANTPAAQAYLTSTSPDRLTGYINFSNEVMWRLWSNLEGAVREGTNRWQATYGGDGPLFSHFFQNDTVKREFLMGMHGFGQISSPQVVQAFDLSRFRTFVDLGGATGHLAIAACQRYPQLQGIVFDLPEAASLAGEIIGNSSVQDRVRFVAGDFFADALPSGDLYALGRILHDWAEEKCLMLLKRIHTALPVGGALLVAEKMLLEERDGPRWAQMQDLNMLTCTEGRERTLADYEKLLQSAGFGKVIGCRTRSPLDAILAEKA